MESDATKKTAAKSVTLSNTKAHFEAVADITLVMLALLFHCQEHGS
jgi:hypothetical protein